MKKFKDFSITRKLLTAFISMIAIILLVGIVGIFGMIKINNLDTYLYENRTAPFRELIAATNSLNQIRSDSLGIIAYAGNAKELEVLEQNYTLHKDTLLKNLDLYRTTMESQNTIMIMDEIKQVFTETYAPAIEKSIAETKQGNTKEALAILTNQENSINKIFEDFDKLIDNRLQSAQETSHSNDMTAGILTVVLIIFVSAGTAAAIYLSLKISRMISTPISQVVEAAKKIALGHVDVDLNEINSKDETGQLAIAFNEMLDGIRKQVLAAEKISNGDFTQEVPLRSKDDILGLALRKIENDLNKTLLLISTAAEQVNTGAEQVSSAAQALASGSTEQAATVEELNASIATVATQADQNATNVRLAAGYVHQTGEGVEESNNHMKNLNGAMERISTASEKISNITKVIEDIAFQTNILALNAAIEAARAGNAGKGFAVVADEVRNLATKSAEAAQETATLIMHSVEAVSEGGHMAGEAARILREVSEKSKLVEQAIQEIENASSQQVTAIEEINQGLSQVSSVVQTNAATAEESSASSEELAAQSVTLQQAVGKFKLKGDQSASTYDPWDTSVPAVMNRSEKY
ncbi:methyl-accepting chemotaxis protein [Clostridium boliviensis]|uniref:Methyl-accepting chemotaxis protein n=1 Tax=Clostridium boliviensis TaxID=318465 RepID=A0ABU4GM56_9CLOT|nr:methyl-accepting chemotaxis protein [Clostridium boliviensis]MDW2797322.1 methyl-accepting chemotaxis protein [Clostridium boliviensis]